MARAWASADRPPPGPARARRRCTQLDGPRRGTEALDRGPTRQCRPLAPVPCLAARPAPRPARRRDAQDAQARLPGGAPIASAPLGRCARAATKSRLDRAAGRGDQTLDSPPHPDGGQAASRIPTCRPLSRSGGSARRPRHRVAGRRARLRPRPRRTLVGRQRRQRPPRAHLAALMKRQGAGGLHVRPRTPAAGDRAQAARQLRFTTSPPALWDGRHVAGKAGSLRRRVGRRPLVGHRQLAPQSRCALDDLRRPDPRAGRTAVAMAGRCQQRRSSRAGPWFTRSRPSPGARPSASSTRFSKSHPEFKLQPFPHPLEDATTGGTLQLWPQIHDGEARFIARMTRRGDAQATDSSMP